MKDHTQEELEAAKKIADEMFDRACVEKVHFNAGILAGITYHKQQLLTGMPKEPADGCYSKEEDDFWFREFNDRYPDEVAEILEKQKSL